MLIRSQCKKYLYNLNTNKGLWITSRAKGVTVIAEGLGDIGQYSTEAKAIKVLDMIQEAYARFSCRYGGDHSGDAVFQMPPDEEAEG